MSGATTRASLAAPAERAMANTCASIDRPPMPCSTLGIAERIRRPLPAAKTTISSGCSFMLADKSCCRHSSTLPGLTTQCACRTVSSSSLWLFAAQRQHPLALRAHVHNAGGWRGCPRVDRAPRGLTRFYTIRIAPQSSVLGRFDGSCKGTRTLLVMAAQASHHAPSGRFIRAYLLTWGLLAAGGLTYLASLAWHPQFLSLGQRPQLAEADSGVQVANRALTEVGSVRRAVTEIQKDVGRIKDTISQRELEEKAAQARLAALEERVTTIAATPVAQANPEPAPAVTPAKAARSGEKSRATAEKRQNGTEPPRAPTHIISVTETPATPVPAAK